MSSTGGQEAKRRGDSSFGEVATQAGWDFIVTQLPGSHQFLLGTRYTHWFTNLDLGGVVSSLDLGGIVSGCHCHLHPWWLETDSAGKVTGSYFGIWLSDSILTRNKKYTANI